MCTAIDTCSYQVESCCCCCKVKESPSWIKSGFIECVWVSVLLSTRGTANFFFFFFSSSPPFFKNLFFVHVLKCIDELGTLQKTKGAHYFNMAADSILLVDRFFFIEWTPVPYAPMVSCHHLWPTTWKANFNLVFITTNWIKTKDNTSSQTNNENRDP